jgi:hypothetical protein
MPMANPAPETCECARGFAAFDCSALRKAFAGAYMANYGHTRAGNRGAGGRLRYATGYGVTASYGRS